MEAPSHHHWHHGRVDDRRAELDRALVAIGDRWSLLLVDALLDGPMRFGELAGAVDGIAPNVLSARLRHLERQGLVRGTPYSERPVRLAYELTDGGRDLAGALTLLRTWGARREGADGPSHHEPCGTAIEARWFCPTCDRVVDDDEAGELRHV